MSAPVIPTEERPAAAAPTARPPRVVHTPWGRTVGLALAAGVAVVVILLAFLWPTITSSVHDLPIAISGSPTAVSAVRSQIEKSAEGALDLTSASSRADAVKLIETRQVDGAIILGEKPEVLTASANGAAVSQLLGQLATRIQAQAQQQADAAVQQAVAAGKAPAGTVAPTIVVPVTDVVPLASTDARGLGLAASSFPLVLGGMLGGILISILVAGSWRRLTAVALYAAAGGLAVTGILQGWFGVLQGGFWANWLAVSLSMLATAALVVGMNALLGRVGIAVGAVITVLIGNPLSSAAQPLQFLAAPWGAIGQWFVPGASVTLLRDLSYFPSADAAFPWLVLVGWAAVGVVALLFGHFRNQEVSEAAA